MRREGNTIVLEQCEHDIVWGALFRYHRYQYRKGGKSDIADQVGDIERQFYKLRCEIVQDNGGWENQDE